MKQGQLFEKSEHYKVAREIYHMLVSAEMELMDGQPNTINPEKSSFKVKYFKKIGDHIH